MSRRIRAAGKPERVFDFFLLKAKKKGDLHAGRAVAPTLRDEMAVNMGIGRLYYPILMYVGIDREGGEERLFRGVRIIIVEFVVSRSDRIAIRLFFILFYFL